MPVDASAMLVDAHVHFHPCYNPAVFLDAAKHNFADAAGRLGLPRNTPGCLLLAECAWHHAFHGFANGTLLDSTSPWRTELTDDPRVLIACCNNQPTLLLVAGRQIITAEGLEVLALACDRAFPDGAPIEAVLTSVAACDAITVLPWGFGKWWGARGRKVKAILNSSWAQHIHVGDNGNRPQASREPTLLRHARRRGIAVLPGSDPLRLAWHQTRAGRYGFVLEMEEPFNSPAAILQTMRAGLWSQPRIFGCRGSWWELARSNMAIRLHRNKREVSFAACTCMDINARVRS